MHFWGGALVDSPPLGPPIISLVLITNVTFTGCYVQLLQNSLCAVTQEELGAGVYNTMGNDQL